MRFDAVFSPIVKEFVHLLIATIITIEYTVTIYVQVEDLFERPDCVVSLCRI